MANRNQIQEEISKYKAVGQDLVRRQYLNDLYEYTGHDTILYMTSFPPSSPLVPAGSLSINIGDINGFMSCLQGLSGDKLDLVIHSPGGSLEATEQLVQYLRAKYNYIRAIIPQNAMSAATMLACACDEIVLGKQSAIGPIDPQMSLTRPNGVTHSLPAHAILADFERAKSEIAMDKSSANVWIPKLLEIPNGFLDLCQKTIELSKSKVAEWLGNYMFKDLPDGREKGSQIAEWLGDFTEHRTHGRPINYKLAREKGLRVTLLEDDQILQDKVLSVFHASIITFEVTLCIKMIENHLGKGTYLSVNPQVAQQHG